MPIAKLDDLVSSEMEALAEEWRQYIRSGSVRPGLAPATVASKIAKGSPHPDTPLIDTEEMVNSIQSGVEIFGDVAVGWIGSDDPKFPMHEYGLGPPERPSLRPIMDANADRHIDKIFDDFMNEVEEEWLR